MAVVGDDGRNRMSLKKKIFLKNKYNLMVLSWRQITLTPLFGDKSIIIQKVYFDTWHIVAN